MTVTVDVRVHFTVGETAQRRSTATRIDTVTPTGRPTRLDHENLDVYRCALDFLRLALRLAASLPRGESETRDQLKTAATSIPVNVAEGAGKPSAADRARYLGIARGSAMECAAWLDVCSIAGHITDADAREGKALLVRIVAMLTRMCR